ncbi:MAG: methyl-accepting chemotaxis protein [Paenibacillaceae bacterium]
MNRLGIIGRMLIGIIIVSCITYGTSGVFIFGLKDVIAPTMPQLIYVSMILSLGVMWTAFLGWLAARWFVRPLIRLTGVMNEAAKGNLRVQVPMHHTQDEIHMLHATFGTLLDNLKQTIRDLAEHGDHTNRQVVSLNHAIQQATEQIEHISETVEHISDDSMKQDLLSQASLNFVREAVETAGVVNKHAQQAMNKSQEMEHIITTSGQQVKSLVNGLQKIEQSNRITLQSITQLKQNTDEINEISVIVGHIASQTQLLSLNASIEAARAGEFGAGFSIVAMEIRKLADHTSSASGHIHERIHQIQLQIDHIAVLMDEQAEEAIREASQGEQVNLALSSVSEAVRVTVHTMEDIARQVDFQAEQVGRTFINTESIAELSQTVSARAANTLFATQEQIAVMQEITVATEELRDKAKQMEQKIQKFES